MADTAAKIPSIAAVFRQPFKEQVAFFRQKMGKLIPTAKWTDVQKSAHDTGFMVAGAAKADLLTDFVVAVDRAITEGKSLGAFQKDFDHIVEKYGWAYHGGREWRANVIYSTNISASYAAGREAQIQAAGYAYKMYQHSDAVLHPRPLHESWDGLVLPVDHPFWDTHTAPNGWGCKCRIIGIRNEAAANRLGGRWGDNPPDGWQKIDPKTGEPVGIDKGWGYRPGATVTNMVQQMAEKTQQWDYTLAKSYMQDLPSAVRDAFSIAYRSLPSVADDARRFSARAISDSPDSKPYFTLGLLTVADAAQVKVITGVDSLLFDYAIDANQTANIRDGLAEKDYSALPELLNSPDSVVSAGISTLSKNPLVKFTKRFSGLVYVAVFEVMTDMKMLSLQNLYISSRSNP